MHLDDSGQADDDGENARLARQNFPIILLIINPFDAELRRMGFISIIFCNLMILINFSTFLVIIPSDYY